jgi:hypothetical protein
VLRNRRTVVAMMAAEHTTEERSGSGAEELR